MEEKKEMEVFEEERECRTEGGRKEVGLARAVERVEQTRNQRESEGNRERNRGRCREMEKVGGRNRLRERNGEESEAFWIFSLQDFVSVAQWSFSSSGKKLSSSV